MSIKIELNIPNRQTVIITSRNHFRIICTNIQGIDPS